MRENYLKIKIPYYKKVIKVSWKDPSEEIMKLRKEMNKLFDNFFDRREMERLYVGKPLDLVIKPGGNVKVSDKDVVVKLNMPGVNKKDITLNVTENYLEVKAEKKKESRLKKKGFFKEERSFRSYHQVILLPAVVKAEDAKAEYKNGVLEVRIPKKKGEKKEVKKITVK